MSIDRFAELRALSGSSLLKLDIQGGELAALRGASKFLSAQQFAIVYSEVVFAPHYENQPLFHELSSFLQERGYSLFRLYDLHTAENGQMRYGDALFVNRAIRARALEE